MTALTLDKIKNMLGAHNDGVYRLQARDDLARIISWLVSECERFRDICVKAEADYRGMAHTFQTNGFRASAREAEETADYISTLR